MRRPAPAPQVSRNPVTLNQATLSVGKGSPVKGLKTVTGSMLGRYGLLVQSAYDRRWVQPSDLSDRNLSVRVKVVIGLDGSVDSASIVGASGVSSLDRSITQLIARVKQMPQPPPSGASLSQRTFVLNFNIKK